MSAVNFVLRRRTLLVLLFNLVCAVGTTAQAADKAAVDRQLDAVRQYQPGQSREALFAVEEVIRTSQGQPELREYIAQRLVNMLNEDGSHDGRLFICRQLWYLAADDSTAALSRMLADEATADMACYAIASDRSPEADKVLRDALAQLNGPPLVRVVNLIGERRDAAVRALAEQSGTKALDAMANVFTRPANETHRILALRGYVRLLQHDTDLIEREKAARYEKAMAAATSDDERRLIIGGLSAVRHAAAIDLARRYVEDTAVQAEAKLAIAKIQESLSRPPEGFAALFDGKTFAGWEGNLDVFRIEDGAIVGGTLKTPIARNEFLCLQQEHGDFELRLKVRLLGDPAGANAGIQIRSRRVPNHHEMSGYQADMGQQYWGCLYDESRRNRVLAQANRAELDKVLALDGWNDYIIRCEGRRIRLWINDCRTVDYTEPEEGIEQTGLIGLQIHGGPPAEAWYKDVFLRRIP